MTMDPNATPDHDTDKAAWLKPEIVSVTPVTETQGNGGAGFDFASESST